MGNDEPKDALPGPRYANRRPSGLSRKREEEHTFSMDPQERSNRQPVLEFLASKKPRGRSIIVGLARNVVICGRVRRRKPFVNVLFYLYPWAEDSVSTTDAIRVKITNTLLLPHHTLLPPYRSTSVA